VPREKAPPLDCRIRASDLDENVTTIRFAPTLKLILRTTESACPRSSEEYGRTSSGYVVIEVIAGILDALDLAQAQLRSGCH